MNELEFLEVLNSIDDDLILNAQTIPGRKYPLSRFGLRSAVLAAVLCLLTASVAAVTIGVRIWTGSEQVVHFEHDFGGLIPFTSRVTTIEYDLQPRSIQLPLQWTQELTGAWKSFGYSYDHFNGVDLRNDDGRRIDFGGVPRLEQLLGLDFISGELLDQAAPQSYVTLAVTAPERCAQQLRREGMVTPDGVVIYLPLQIDSEDIDYCGLSIFLPLTDSFAQYYASHAVLSSVYNQELRQSTLYSGELEIVILENTPGEEDPLSGFAAWEHGGIGYLIEIKTTRDCAASSMELLTPYLNDLEE